jgi:hypothetical protein
MIPRTDFLTAMRADLALILLPVISAEEAAVMLASSEVPPEVAVRVLFSPHECRRQVESALQAFHVLNVDSLMGVQPSQANP